MWPTIDQDLTYAMVKTSPKSTPSNLSQVDQPLTKIRLRIIGLSCECTDDGIYSRSWLSGHLGDPPRTTLNPTALGGIVKMNKTAIVCI